MTERARHSFSEKLWIVMATGLLLRLYQIGNDPFWFDELNVLQIASRPTLLEAIRATAEHVMAMPSHYVLVWLAAKISTAEGWMRLPEAIWGTLAIGMGYQVARSYLTPSQSQWAAALMAIAPILIRYSQELRFYSALVFFYLLAVFFGIRAIQRDRLKDWVIYCLVTSLGITFHVYVLLSWFIVMAYFFSSELSTEPPKVYRRLLRSTIILLIIFLGLLIAFGKMADQAFRLNEEGHLFWIILAGIGWAPSYATTSGGWLYYCLIVFSGVLGFLQWTRLESQKKTAIFLFISIVVQISLVALFNVLGEYFIDPRQLIFLLPFVSFYSAFGLEMTSQWIEQRIDSNYIHRGQMRVGIFMLVMVSGLLTLAQYYQVEKGIVREGLPALQERWQEKDLICIFPESDAVTYTYYWLSTFGNVIFPCDELSRGELSKVRFILAPPNWVPKDGYRLIFKPDKPTFYERWIWEKITRTHTLNLIRNVLTISISSVTPFSYMSILYYAHIEL